MENSLPLKAQIREQAGSKHAVKVRKSGRIPAIVYGHKEEPVAISLDAHNFMEGLHHSQRLMDVQIGKNKQTVIIKDLQYDYLGKNIIHVDLMRVDATERIKVSVPIELKGTAKGSHEGGIIEKHSDHLEIECMATNIPESIIVSVKELGVGDVVHAGEIELPEGTKLVSPADMLVIACHLVTVAKTTEEIEEETPAGPEVIGEAERKKEEEEGEEPPKQE